jgi:hypothetical protein
MNAEVFIRSQGHGPINTGFYTLDYIDFQNKVFRILEYTGILALKDYRIMYADKLMPVYVRLIFKGDDYERSEHNIYLVHDACTGCQLRMFEENYIGDEVVQKYFPSAVKLGQFFITEQEFVELHIL